MPGREIASKTESEIALNITIFSSNGILQGSVIDLQRSNAVLFAILAGEIVDGTHAFTFEESEDVGFSSPIVITDNDLRGNVLANLVFTNAEEGTLQQVSLVNNKRFVRIIVTTSGASTGGTLGAVAVKQDLSLTPTI